MSGLKRLPARLLSCRVLPHADPRLCTALGLPAVADGRSLALMTCDQDDSLYAALDHATKIADVEVIYARSFYAGSAHASGPLSGEILGVLAADDPESNAQAVAGGRVALPFPTGLISRCARWRPKGRGTRAARPPKRAWPSRSS